MNLIRKMTKDRIEHHFRRLSAILLAVILLIGGFAGTGARTVYAFSNKQGYVTNGGDATVSEVNVRTGAGTATSAVCKLPVGQEVLVIGEATASNGALWYKISFSYQGSETVGYMHSTYIRTLLPQITAGEDPDYEKYLDTQQFPEHYRTYLRALHKLHPTWIFISQPTQQDWKTAVSNECVLGRNLVQTGSISSWKSLEPGAFDWNTGIWTGLDSSSWVAASAGVIRYYMDPRNFLREEAGILQFSALNYVEGEQTTEGVAGILKGTFMESEDYYRIFLEAGRQSGVSPYHLASRCRQEVGVKGSNSTYEIKSEEYREFDGCYNYFNIGASPSSDHNSMYNGLARAKSEGWNSAEASIIGGAKFLAERYVGKGQNTLYLQKFDVVDGGNGRYSHQYMTNLQAAASEALAMKKAYADFDVATVSYYIPVYDNMPDTACKLPTDNGSPYSVLSSLSVDGLTFTEDFEGHFLSYSVKEPVTDEYVTVQATAYSPGADISGTGTKSLSPGENELKITCTGADGSNHTYSIHIVREIVRPHILGDVDFDGNITVKDALKVLRFVAEMDPTDEEQQELCDTNHNGITDAGDALQILRYVTQKISAF